MNNLRLNRRRTLGAMLAAPLALSACGGTDDSQLARVRSVNLSTDVPSLDVFEDDTLRFAAVAPNAPTDYASLRPGTATWRVRKAGAGIALVSQSISTAKDKNYTWVVWGRESALRLSTLLEDGTNTDINSGSLRLRVLNASADSGAVDVYLTSSTAELAEAASTVSGVASAATSDFVELSRGTYRLRVTGAGDPADLRLDIASVVLDTREHVTLVLTAGASGVLLNGSLIAQQGSAVTLTNTQARVRVVAGVDSGAVVGVSLAGRTLAGASSSPSVAPYQLVDAGSQTLVVRVAGVQVSSQTLNFAAGSDHTVLVYGPAAGSSGASVSLLVDDNRLPSVATRTKVRLMHGAASLAELTLSVDFLALGDPLVAGAASPFSTLASSSSARVSVSSAAAATAIYNVEEVNLQAQGVYTVFVLGGAAGPTGLIRRER